MDSQKVRIELEKAELLSNETHIKGPVVAGRDGRRSSARDTPPAARLRPHMILERVRVSFSSRSFESRVSSSQFRRRWRVQTRLARKGPSRLSSTRSIVSSIVYDTLCQGSTSLNSSLIRRREPQPRVSTSTSAYCTTNAAAFRSRARLICISSGCVQVSERGSCPLKVRF